MPVRPLASLTAIPILDARMSSTYHGPFAAANCFDGSTNTACVSRRTAANWLSVRTAGRTRIGAVAIYNNGDWNDVPVAPFEVWVGTSFGDTSDLTATRCGPTVHSTPERVAHGPLRLVVCDGGGRPAPGTGSPSAPSAPAFVTLRQLGPARVLYVTELVLYAHPLVDAALLPGAASRVTRLSKRPEARRPREAVVSDINHRFQRGDVASDLQSAGVLIHMIDHYEEANEPWQVCG